ncbi:MAG: hypothetical protein WC505_04615 [Patescibacteria group bacterium]
MANFYSDPHTIHTALAKGQIAAQAAGTNLSVPAEDGVAAMVGSAAKSKSVPHGETKNRTVRGALEAGLQSYRDEETGKKAADRPESGLGEGIRGDTDELAAAAQQAAAGAPEEKRETLRDRIRENLSVSPKDEPATKRALNNERRQGQTLPENMTERGKGEETQQQEGEPGAGDTSKLTKAARKIGGEKAAAATQKALNAKKKLQSAAKVAAKLMNVGAIARTLIQPLFMLTIGLTLSKDTYDIITQYFDVGLTAALLNIAITSALTVILVYRGSGVRGKMVKKVRRYAIGAVAEFIPYVSLLPFWTILVLYDELKKN